jgi:hypothetical protein
VVDYRRLLSVISAVRSWGAVFFIAMCRQVDVDQCSRCV